jgi:hypothetical protein
VNEFVSEPSFSDELNVTLAYQQWSTINTLRLVSEEVAEVIAMARNVPYCRLERSRWRDGRCACDTSAIMRGQSVLNRFSPLSSNSLLFCLLQAGADSIPIA